MTRVDLLVRRFQRILRFTKFIKKFRHLPRILQKLSQEAYKGCLVRIGGRLRRANSLKARLSIQLGILRRPNFAALYELVYVIQAALT